MKLENILKQVNDLYQNYDINKIIKLKNELEEAIRLESSYAHNSKSKVNAIVKMMKYNKKNNRERFNKAFTTDNKQYLFTNTYYMIRLNDNLGYEIENKDYNYLIDNVKHNYDIIDVDLNNVIANIKLKEHTKINNVSFNSQFLKEIFDTLGKNTNVYMDISNTTLIFENDKNEKAILLYCKTY